MNNHEQYKRLLRFLFCAVLLIIQMLLFWYIWRRYYSPRMDEPFFKRGHWMMVAVYGLLLLFFAKPYGSWRIGYLKTFSLIYAQGITTVFSNIMMYVMITLLTKHFESIYPMLFMCGVQLVVISIWGVLCSRLYLTAYPPRKVLLVYGERPIKSLMFKLSSRTDRFNVGQTIHISEGMDTIQEAIKDYEGVVIGDLPSNIRNTLLKYCYEKSIRTYTSPKISDILIRSAEIQHMFDTPLLMSRNSGLSIEQQIVKRIFDITLSVCALIILSPMLLLTALAIRLEDGGPVFFRQDRCTKDGKVFSICKFRSMVVNAEKAGKPRPARKGDPRITKVGHFIRMTRIDELPQLFNILKGDMSIVGPRPERVEHVRKYSAQIPEFKYRMKVKGGLTGYAQVYGKYNTNAYDKLKLDLMYIQNYSLLMDMEIIFQTIRILFTRESTEGFTKEQAAALEKGNGQKGK